LHWLRLVPTQQDKLLRILYRQHSPHDGINQAKDGRIRADAQGQRQHGHGGKAWAAAQLTQTVSNIL
jgi:hypothetical protein